MKYSIGSNLDNNSINITAKLAKKYGINFNDIELFLGYPKNNFSYNRSIIKDISKKDFIKHIKLIQHYGFGVNYLFNSLGINFEKDKEKLLKEIEFLQKLNINIVTITNLKLLKIIPSNIDIVLSTTLDIKNVVDFENILNKVEKQSIKRIVLAHQVNKSFDELKNIIMFGKRNGIKIEIIVNEPCSISCKVRKIHYYYDNTREKIFSCPYKIDENNFKSSISAFIMPEDTKKYEEIGIDFFKVATRNRKITPFFNNIKYYFSENFSGNYSDIMNNT